MLNCLYRSKVKIIILFISGVILSLLLKSAIELKTFLSDMFFCVSMVFFLYGLWGFVMKTGFFNSLIFGTQCFVKLAKSKLSSSEYIKDEYIDFIKYHQKEYDILCFIVLSLIFFIISVITSIIV